MTPTLSVEAFQLSEIVLAVGALADSPVGALGGVVSGGGGGGGGGGGVPPPAQDWPLIRQPCGAGDVPEYATWNPTSALAPGAIVLSQDALVTT